LKSASEKGNPYVDMARLLKKAGYNKDVTLSTATIVGTAPLTVKLTENSLVTKNLVPMAHLVPHYLPAQIVFDDELGKRSAQIMIDNSLEIGELVYCIYESVNGRLSGFIIGKEE
jgi:Protein of unknown function (DUF2577)